MTNFVGDAFATLEKCICWTVRSIWAMGPIITLLYFPVVHFHPCYPPLLPSWIASCEADTSQIHTEFSFTLFLLGIINLSVILHCLQDSNFHGSIVVFVSITCLFQYVIIIDRCVYISLCHLLKKV